MLEEKIGDDPNLNLHVRWKRKRLILNTICENLWGNLDNK